MDRQDWDARYRAAEPVWGLEPNRWVVRECAGLPPGRALDLAAGEGRNAIWLAERGWQVTAVDFSAVALERGRTLAAARPPGTADRLTWVTADVLTHTPDPAGYDLVLVAYLQVPAADRRAALRAAAGALAPGGTLLVVGHHSANPAEGVGGPQDPRVLFTPEDVLADLDGLGLAVDRAERALRAVAAPDGHGAAGTAIDALARLHRPLGG
ncbi:class I SAM-dependent methyltransferase [Kitasatospora sp. NPDC059571]|uniref:class I SAM-dependent methyltransferase n=1 Tax=Kitasatospora sp. NPDC059571 TaxID=3346871 RepID=UPI0036B91E77